MRIQPFYLVVFAIWLTISSCQPEKQNKFDDPEMRTIHLLKDKRSTNELLKYLSHTTAKYRAEAALSLASVGDPTASKTLMQRLKTENDGEVQTCLSLAAYHCGVADDVAPQELDLIWKNLQSAKAKNEWLRTVGHICDSAGLTWVDQLQEESPIEEGVIRCYYELAQRKHVTSKTIKTAIDCLKNTHTAETQRWAAYMLYRCFRVGKDDFSAHTDVLLNAFRKHSDPLVRLKLAHCIQGTQSERAAEILVEALQNDPDYRVKVAALLSLKKKDYVASVQTAAGLLHHENLNLAFAAGQFFVNCGKPEEAQTYLEMAQKVENWRAQAQLVGAAYIHGQDSAKVRAMETMIVTINGSTNTYQRTEYMRILAQHPVGLVSLEGFLQTGQTPLEKATCLEGLAQIAEKLALPATANQYDEILKRIRLQLIDHCHSNDEHIAAIAAKYLRSPSLNIQNELLDFQFLVKGAEKWKLPQYYETRLEFEKTHRYFKGEPFNDIHPSNPYNNPIDFSFLETRKNKEGIYRFETSKGAIRLQFHFDDAPGTAIYIAKLAESGFYNGKKFHRVVPNFVAQGGCPRGDGVGATDLSLRSEFTFAEYDEGTVGMASAGKDTESCQFFITHNSTPHLNGRYTIFAHVVEGMEVVHQLEIGDEIISIH